MIRAEVNKGYRFEPMKFPMHFGPTPIEKESGEMLYGLREEQIREFRSIDLEPFKSKSSRDLFLALVVTPRFRAAMRELRTLKQTGFPQVDLKADFAGRIFKDLSFYVMAAQEYPDRILLSPERAQRYFAEKYFDRPRFNNSFGNLGICGISLPDGIIIDRSYSKPKIHGFTESSAAPFEDRRYEEKTRSLTLKLKAGIFREPGRYAQESNLRFATLLRSNGSELPAAFKHELVELSELPIVPSQLWDFTNNCHKVIEANLEGKRA